jgi:hypothetical protein
METFLYLILTFLIFLIVPGIGFAIEKSKGKSTSEILSEGVKKYNAEAHDSWILEEMEEIHRRSRDDDLRWSPGCSHIPGNIFYQSPRHDRDSFN